MTTPYYADPSAARRKLRNELRMARESAGMRLQRAAESLDWSLSKLLRIESGSVAVAVTDLRALLGLYGVTDKDRVQDLVTAARASRGRPWWYEYREIVRPQFAQFLGYESAATNMRMFGLALVPGVLQTEDYAAAVIGAHSGSDGLGASDKHVTLRVERGVRLFERDDVAEISVLLDEASLRRRVGGGQVMRRQLGHLADLAARPHVALGVLPFDAGAHPAMTGPFTVLQFPDGQDDVLYLDGVSGDVLVRDDQEQVAEYLAKFEAMGDQARTGDEAIELISRLAAGL